jgi:glycosyltransferase involved in cell wall biosynthesis
VRVAVTAAGLAHRTTGIERYARGFLSAAMQLPDVEVVACVPDWLADSLSLPEARTVRIPRLPAPLGVEVALLPALRDVGAHVVHGLDLAIPRLRRAPWVQTVHDDVLLASSPSGLSRGGRWYYRPSLRAALRSRRTTAVVTTSRSAAAAIADHSRPGLPIHALGAGPSLAGDRARGNQEDASRRLAGPLRVVSVGTVEPRKDLPTMAATLTLLRTAGVDVRWQHVGRTGWGHQVGDLEYLGEVSDDRLQRAYAEADVFVSASLAEGYDLAAAEARAHGLRGVLSDIPVHREMHADWAALVPAQAPRKFATALRALGVEPPAKPHQAHARSWEQVAEGAAAVWRQAVQ